MLSYPARLRLRPGVSSDSAGLPAAGLLALGPLSGGDPSVPAIRDLSHSARPARPGSLQQAHKPTHNRIFPQTEAFVCILAPMTHRDLLLPSIPIFADLVPCCWLSACPLTAQVMGSNSRTACCSSVTGNSKPAHLVGWPEASSAGMQRGGEH